MFTYLIDIDRHTPAQVARFNYEVQREMQALYESENAEALLKQAQAAQPRVTFAPEVEAIMERFDTHDGGAGSAVRRRVATMVLDLGGAVLPPVARVEGSDRAYLRLILGGRNFGYMNTVSIGLVGARHLPSVGHLAATGVVETTNREKGKPHKYPHLAYTAMPVIEDLLREFAAKPVGRRAA